MMPHSLEGMAIAAGLLWAAAIWCLAILHITDPNYGANFLRTPSSVYPGFPVAGRAGSTAAGTVEGFIGGASNGLLLAWLYNCFSPIRSQT